MKTSDLDELDKLAAEKIMGWYYREEYKRFEYQPRGDATTPCSPKDWKPTRNIAQAWQCFERFEERTIRSVKNRYEAYVSIPVDGMHEGFYGQGGTAAEAIVRACLKAKGVTEIGGFEWSYA